MLHSKTILSLLLASVALAPAASANHDAVLKTDNFKDPDNLKLSIALCVGSSKDIDEMAATPDGEWVVISGTTVGHSTNFPADALAKINEYIHMGKQIDCVAFTPGGGWMIIAEDLAARSGSISYLPLLEQQILSLVNNNVRCRELVFDADNDGWALIADHYVYMQKMPREFHDAVADGGSSKRVVNRISMGFLGSFCVMADDWYATTAVGNELIVGLKKFQKERISMDRIMLGPMDNFVLYSNGIYTPDLTKGIKQMEYRIAAGQSPTGGTIYKSIWQRMEELKIAGVSIGIIEDNQIKWARGYGEIEKGTQKFVRRSTPFDTASVSKSISAGGMLTYMDDPGSQMHLWTNVMDAAAVGNPLTNPLSLWVNFGGNYQTVQNVPFAAMTVERLLSHTASLEPWSSKVYLPGQAAPSMTQLLFGGYYDDNNQIQLGGGSMPWYNPTILEGSGDMNIYFPGEAFRYSGGGFLVAQAMTEIFTNKPFDEFMQQRILTPLGMVDSTMVQPLPANFEDRAAVPHDADGNPVGKSKRPFFPWLSAGGLWSTPRDFANFIITLNQNGKAPNGNQLIKPLYVKEMLKDHTPEWNKRYGFGVNLTANFVNDTNGEYYTHNGGHEGAQARMAGNPTKKQGVVILVNAGDDSAKKLVNELYSTFRRAYNWD
ncbi:MAG: serine hydrolase domain-containing protein [Planctomycetota bacterium]